MMSCRSARITATETSAMTAMAILEPMVEAYGASAMVNVVLLAAR